MGKGRHGSYKEGNGRVVSLSIALETSEELYDKEQVCSRYKGIQMVMGNINDDK